MVKHLIVTHHAPDIDAVGAVWILRRFDNQHYADAQVAFVDPGATINPSEAERLGFQMHQVVHVDTGKGEFDHHQPERGKLRICASSLIYDHVCKIHPELGEDQALKEIVELIIQDDHFEEIYWPEADSLRYCFMVPELLRGMENVDPHDDDSQLEFGMKCLDSAYAIMKETIQANEHLKEGQEIEMPFGKCLAIETRNDGVIKQAQKSGFAVVIRKDPKSGEARIKARPDAKIDLTAMYDAVCKIDKVGSWYNHPSGKMLLNGSRKQRNQNPTKLSLSELINIFQEVYGQK